MRVFILGTGRCGSTTMAKACTHVEGHTVGHESYKNQSWFEFVDDIPENHFEVSFNLVYSMMVLAEMYPDSVFIHLKRYREACVDSLQQTCRQIVQRFNQLVLMTQTSADSPAERKREAAESYYDGVNHMIKAGLAAINDPDRRWTIEIENPKPSWKGFWKRFDLAGSLENSLAEFDYNYNARGHRHERFSNLLFRSKK